MRILKGVGWKHDAAVVPARHSPLVRVWQGARHQTNETQTANSYRQRAAPERSATIYRACYRSCKRYNLNVGNKPGPEMNVGAATPPCLGGVDAPRVRSLLCVSRTAHSQLDREQRAGGCYSLQFRQIAQHTKTDNGLQFKPYILCGFLGGPL